MTSYLRRAAGIFDAPVVRPLSIPVYGSPIGRGRQLAPVPFAAAEPSPVHGVSSGQQPTATGETPGVMEFSVAAPHAAQALPEHTEKTLVQREVSVLAEKHAEPARATTAVASASRWTAPASPVVDTKDQSAATDRSLETERPVVTGSRVGAALPTVAERSVFAPSVAPVVPAPARRSAARPTVPVQVTIGRVEIRAAIPESQRATGRTTSSRRRPAISLDDYLGGRKA